jgi:hypothetical protein
VPVPGLEPIEHERAVLRANVLDAARVRRGEPPAHGGHIGQALQPKQALDHLVVAVVARVAKLAVTQQQVHDEQHRDNVVPVDRAAAQMAEAAPQALLEPDAGEELLEQDKPGERSQ